jgi:hypothetical protein
VLSYDYLDLGLARSVIRAARREGTSSIAKHLLARFDFLVPATNDVVIYLNEVTDAELAAELRPMIESLIGTAALDSQLVRFWMEWYVAQHSELMQSTTIYQFVFGGTNIETQALAAITTKNVAWVRSHKATVYNLGGWSRRAILNASRVLPSDERTHWLKLFIGNSPVILDRWVANWVLESS